jgi:hypothetical protein
MTDDQIKHMVNRFLQWKLPESFSPDNGISFKPTFNDDPRTWKALGITEPMKCNPIGTNLFDATQAEAMVRFLVEGMPGARDAAAASDKIAQARAALRDAELTRDRLKNAMTSSTFGGRCRTDEAQTAVDQLRADLASLEAAGAQP